MENLVGTWKCQFAQEDCDQESGDSIKETILDSNLVKILDRRRESRISLYDFIYFIQTSLSPRIYYSLWVDSRIILDKVIYNLRIHFSERFVELVKRKKYAEWDERSEERGKRKNNKK